MTMFFKVATALGVLVVPAMALAHDRTTPHATRGACEAALAQANHNDGALKVESGEFENFGESNEWMHDTFRCERIGDDWYIVLNDAG